MSAALVEDPFENDPAEFLEWAFGKSARTYFVDSVIFGQRRGQAFMNALRMHASEEYVKLAGTNVDPFYVDDKIPLAIEKITSK